MYSPSLIFWGSNSLEFSPTQSRRFHAVYVLQCINEVRCRGQPNGDQWKASGMHIIHPLIPAVHLSPSPPPPPCWALLHHMLTFLWPGSWVWVIACNQLGSKWCSVDLLKQVNKAPETSKLITKYNMNICTCVKLFFAIIFIGLEEGLCRGLHFETTELPDLKDNIFYTEFNSLFLKFTLCGCAMLQNYY